ncbi:TDRD3 family protein [Megaselia abdita]
MKSALEKLNKQGWYLSEEGLQEWDPNLFKNGDQNVNLDHIINLACHADFRDIAKNGGALPADGTKGVDSLPGKIVLQIAKVSNLSAPKSNQESKTAPRLLQIDFTDGKTSIQALELDAVPNFSLDTPPGTKVYFKCEKIPLFHGFMILKSKDIQVIGGKVPHLIEKWELNRKLNKYSKDIRLLRSSGGPPRWVAFGQHIENTLNGVKETKPEVKQQENGNVEPKSNDFEAQRIEAIAEAAKSGNKKTFGGANNVLPDFNVKKIMDKGYSEEDARSALRHTRNNLERAMFNLKRRGGSEGRPLSNGPPLKPTDRRGRKIEETAPSGKPTNVSLFDFLTEKFPEESSSLPSVVNPNQPPKPLPATSAPPMTVKSDSDKFVKRENPFRKFDNYNSRESFHRGDGYRGKDDHYGSYNRNDYKASKDDTYRGKDEKYRSKDDNFRSNEDKGKETKDDYYNRNKDRPPYQSNSYNKYNNPRFNSTQQPHGVINSSRPTPNYAKPHDQSRNYNNNRPNFKPQDNNDTRYNPRREPYHPKSSNNFKKPDPKSTVSEVTDGLSKMSMSHNTSPPQHQYNQQNKREDKRDDRNKVKNYPYDPCKIVGFQNKETNEFALSMLKAQGMQPPPEEHLPHDANTITVSTPNTMPQIPMQVQSPPQPNTFMAMPIYNAPTIHGHPQVQMQAIATTPMGEYQWNIGDHCLAKYWDDEKLYEAQITGVTQNTCVVFFTNYGNYEEVLKADCYPIITENIAMGPGGHPMAIQMPLALPIPIQMSGIPTQHPPHQTPNYINRNRTRGERQMYVPPAKRDR